MTDGRAIFEEIRNRPYAVVADKGVKPQQCYHKNTELIARLAELGYGVRGRIGEIGWSDLGLPQEMVDLYPQDIMPTHFYCEIWDGGDWRILDASWDPAMKHVGPVSEWDGADNASGFTIRKLYTVEEQTAFFDYWSDPVRGEDYVHRAAPFLKAFDGWLAEQRMKAAA